MLVGVAAFVFVLGVLIFVHELGHFMAAKAAGIGVPRFSIGFGPATPLRFRRGETEYVVAWFPLGGYVKMASREEQEAMASMEGGATPEEFPPDELFENKPLGWRIVVITAGVAMNAVFAWAAYVALAAIVGGAEDRTTRIGWVDGTALPAEASALATLPRGTQITRINGDTMPTWQAIERAVLDPRSAALRFEFAGRPPIEVPVRGTEGRQRLALHGALRPDWPTEVGVVTGGMPADRAGIRPGDVIVAVNGDTARSFYDFQPVIEHAAGDAVTLAVARGDSVFRITVTPEEVEEPDPLAGRSRRVGRIGIGPAVELVRVRYGFGEAIAAGTAEAWDKTMIVLVTLRGLARGEVSVRELGGPIFIGQASGQFARQGGAALLAFMAFLSINLAVLNLLPIPVLDGGHLVFLMIEGIRGRPLPLDLRLKLTQVGMLMLLVLMVIVFANDIRRLMGG